MKKTKWLFLAIAFNAFVTQHSFAQSQYWFLSPNTVNTSTGSGTTTSSSTYDVSDGAYNSSGTLQFHVIDNGVYNSTGGFIGNLPDYYDPAYDPALPTTDFYGRISGQMAIVPVPGSCSVYYVIYDKTATDGGGTKLLYVTVNVSTNTIGSTTTVVDAVHTSHTCATVIQVGQSGTPGNTDFAVSKRINSNGDRYLYTIVNANAPECDRFTINSTGISSGSKLKIADYTTKSSLSMANGTGGDFETHCLKLSPDQRYLAWYSHNTSGHTIYEIVLNGNTYYDMNKLTVSSSVYGLDFSGDSHTLYFSDNSGIQYVNSDLSGSISTISGTTAYSTSGLALGANGKMYAVNTSTHNLNYVDITSTSFPVTTTTIPVPSNGTFNWNSFYRLPKQKFLCSESTQLNIDGTNLSTLCAPGNASNGANPKFSVSVSGGTPAYSYTWYPLADNNTTLDNYSSATPTITTATSPYLVDYDLVVTDNSTGAQVASRIVKIQLKTTSTFDLAMKDSYADLMDEPNSSVATDWNIWLSPDVWNRKIADGITTHQNPEYFTSAPDYVYVNVRNIGCAAFDPSVNSANLDLYWTLASTGENWSSDWTTSPKGGLIYSYPINTVLNPGDIMTYHQAWYPANPASFVTGATQVDACFLARIDDGHITYPETTRVKTNIINNNNIVTRNFIIVNLNHQHPSAPPHIIYLANGENIAQAFNFNIATDNFFNPNYGGNISGITSVTLGLGNLFGILLQNNSLNGYSSIDYNNQTVTYTGSDFIQIPNITLAPGEKDPISVTFSLNNNVTIPTFNQNIHFYQDIINQNQTTAMYGNVTFQVTTDTTSDSSGGGNGGRLVQAQQNKETSPRFTVYPNPTSNYFTVYSDNCTTTAKITVTDIEGKVITEFDNDFSKSAKVNINLTKYANGVYNVRIASPGIMPQVHTLIKE